MRVTPIEVEEPLVGTVTSLGPDALQLSGSGGVRSLSYAEIAAIERSLGCRNNIGKGLAIGAGTGLVLGGLFGVWLADEICGSCDPEYGAAFSAFGAVGLVSGGLLGLVIGAATSTERWEEVPFRPGLTTGLILEPDPAGGAGVIVGLRLPFDATPWAIESVTVPGAACAAQVPDVGPSISRSSDSISRSAAPRRLGYPSNGLSRSS